MRVILAAPRGFCAGVNMAIEALELAIEAYGTPLYVYHEIVHNKWVVASFRQRGVVFVNSLAEVPEEAHLLYSAHGVPPEIRRQAAERRLKTIDATCPLVTKVHREAVRFAQRGYTILLIGHAGHDEVVGTMGEVPDAIRLVQTVADAEQVEVPDPAKIAYLTQTTLSIDDAAKIIERLRQRFPEIVGPTRDDICYATQNRQEAVRVLANEAGSQLYGERSRLSELSHPEKYRTNQTVQRIKRGTGSEPMGGNAAENGGGEVPVPLFQQAAREEAERGTRSEPTDANAGDCPNFCGHRGEAVVDKNGTVPFGGALPARPVVLVVGSQNSSNSRRLAELAIACGVSAHLIDGPADIDLGWFSGDETVVLTAGASAPEGLVEECVGLLQQRFDASVETRVIRQEQLRFSLPKPLRKKP